jgi:hypothetical protein
MPDIFTFDNVNDELCNVFGMVPDTLQGLGDKKQIKTRTDGSRIFHHVSDELANKTIELFVNQIILFQDGQSGGCVQAGKGVQ